MGGKGKNTPKKQQPSPAPSPQPEQKQQQQPQQSPAKSKAKPQNEPSPVAQSPQPSKQQSQPSPQPSKAPASPAPAPQPAVSVPSKTLETPVKATPSPAPSASPQVSPPAPTPPPAGASREAKEKNEKKDPVVRVFESNLEKQPEIAIAVAAIQALTDVVKRSKAATMMGLEIELKAATDKLKACNVHSISLAAGCELFNRYVTRTSLEIGDFDKCRSRLIERGDHFTHMSLTSRKKISEFGDRFIRDGKSILCHGYSRVVIAVLVHAAKKGKYFSVIVTEGRPTGVGAMMAEELIKHNIPVTIVLDSAVGYVMEKVDLVLVGAEGVVESGGIINQIGTYQIALVAKALQTPFYVAAESYKFARLFPLTQNDLPESKEVQRPLASCNPEAPFPEKATINNPRCDYTPPQYITLLFTDLGILTPSAISDELIKLYY